MSKNSRTEKARVTESADFGAYFLILAVVAVGALAYFSEDFWAKVGKSYRNSRSAVFFRFRFFLLLIKVLKC